MENEISMEMKKQTPLFREKIGSTIYEVTVHFSETNKETMDDKLKRLILNDSANQISRFS